jgi:hypothetical protein
MSCQLKHYQPIYYKNQRLLVYFNCIRNRLLCAPALCIYVYFVLLPLIIFVSRLRNRDKNFLSFFLTFSSALLPFFVQFLFLLYYQIVPPFLFPKFQCHATQSGYGTRNSEATAGTVLYITGTPNDAGKLSESRPVQANRIAWLTKTINHAWIYGKAVDGLDSWAHSSLHTNTFVTTGQNFSTWTVS